MTDQQKRARLREILRDGEGAIAPGVTDALFARLVQDCGYPAAHLSGNAIHKNFCLPDRNLLTITQIAQRVGQISESSDIPLIVDSGTICIAAAVLARTVKSYERAGAAALRFEDGLVNEYGAPAEELAIAPLPVVVDRIKAAADARTDSLLVLIARCDSRPKGSVDQVLERLAAYARGRCRCDWRAAYRCRRLPSHWRPSACTVGQLMAQGANERVRVFPNGISHRTHAFQPSARCIRRRERPASRA
jgi:2-methylisocitrate lyase-like PEP mutase family enzyme